VHFEHHQPFRDAPSNIPVDALVLCHCVMRGLTKLVPLALGAAAFGRLVRMRAGAAKATRAAKAVPPTPPVVRDPPRKRFFGSISDADAVDARERRASSAEAAGRASRTRRQRVPFDATERARLTTPHTTRFTDPRFLLRPSSMRRRRERRFSAATKSFRAGEEEAAQGSFRGCSRREPRVEPHVPPHRARRRFVLAPGRQ
jgi:hypothetical protein